MNLFSGSVSYESGAPSFQKPVEEAECLPAQNPVMLTGMLQPAHRANRQLIQQGRSAEEFNKCR